MEGFVKATGYTLEEFHTECKDALEDKYCALFEDHQYKFFVSMLLSVLDYDHFYGLMVNECRLQLSQRK